ncbi:hypothetical protein F9K33_08670 [bacterium]|nr:MAG: hypothetical protein F9K33_08670 [bacterium]
MAKSSAKKASKITMARKSDENDAMMKFAQFMGWLKEDRILNARKKVNDELQEGIRQLEWAVLKLEAEEKGALTSLNLQWHEKRLKAASLTDLEKELKEFTRQYHKLKNLENQQMQITEKGMYEKAAVERIEYEITSLIRDPDLINELKGVIELKKTEIQSLRNEYLLMEDQIKKMEVIPKQIATLELLIADAKRAEHDSQTLQEEIEKIRNQLSKQSFAKRELMAIEDMKRQISASNYDVAHHKEVRQLIDRYLEFELPVWLKEAGLIE